MSMQHEASDSGGKSREAASGRNGPNVALIAVLVVIALGVIFFFRNEEPVELDFLVFNKHTTVRWLIVVSIILGVLLDRFFGIWWRRRGRRDNG